MRRVVPLLLVLPGAVFGLLSCLPVEKSSNPDLTGQTVRLTLLHTSDIHSRLLPYDLAPIKTDVDLGLSPEAPPYGGVARLAALIKRERAAADRSMLLDSGDCFQGAPIFNSNDGEAEIRFMSLMQYDGVVIGNHEFDKGPHNFADKIERFASYRPLAANYLWENTGAANAHGIDKLAAPYTITNIRGVKVAILGMANISSMNSLVDGGNSLQAVPLEQNETARAYVQMLMPVVDLVVVVSHLGLTEDQDLLTGYEAYYSLENAKPFLSRKENAWTQVEPDPKVCEKLGDSRCTFVDGTVRVFIPGVSGIDVIEGGHLHVVLNPPQVVRDPSGRPVIISHSGAFSKYLGRLDLEIEFPPAAPGADATPEEKEKYAQRKFLGAEVVAHDYRAFPVDGIWCDNEARAWRSAPGIQLDQYPALVQNRPRTDDCRQRFFQALPNALVDECFANYDADFRTYKCDRYLPENCKSRIERCSAKEDRRTTDLLQPYVIGLDESLALSRIFAFAPKDIARRNSSTGGDAPLGNMCAESMRVRKRVEAELSLTNTLGIRDNLYAGPITLESMFNVFPFENTINVMYLSGAELQELTDFVASRSSDRGCQSQAQISGMRFTMDCAQAVSNALQQPCEKSSDCSQYGKVENPAGWQCTPEKVCWAHPSFGLSVAGKSVNPNASYKIAVNDYIARGGSGFKVLKRNTTRIETGISLRDSLIDWMRGQCTCDDVLSGRARSAAGFACASAHDGAQLVVDPIVRSYCSTAREFETALKAWQAKPADSRGKLSGAPTLFAGKCGCQEVINGDEKACGHVTTDLRNFCQAPTQVPIAIGDEDGRIGRRVR